MALKMVAVIRKLDQLMSFVSIAFSILSGITIVGMVGVVTVDATLRKVFGTAFYGSYDTVTYLLSILIFLSLVICQRHNSHFSIDVITVRFPYRVQMGLNSIVLFISVLVEWLLSWKLFEYGARLKRMNSTMMELNFIPTYPFAWVGGLCFLILGFMMLSAALKCLLKLEQEQD